MTAVPGPSGARSGHVDVDGGPGGRDRGWSGACASLAAVPVGRLTERDRRLVRIAVDASAAHLYEPGLRRHVRAALEAGVVVEEIIEVLEMVSVLGIHACTMAMPVLVQEAGTDTRTAGDDRRVRAVRGRFERGRGMWPPFFDDMVALDPGFIDAYLRYSRVPWESGRIAPGLRELIYIAIDAAATHLYEAGTRTHIQNALRAGVSVEEITEVLELVVLAGIDSYEMAIPLLDEEIAATAP